MDDIVRLCATYARGCLGISAVFLAAIVIFIFVHLCNKDSCRRYLYSFKNGKFLFVYIAAIPLYMAGMLHAAPDLLGNYALQPSDFIGIFLEIFFKSLETSIALLALRFNFDKIESFYMTDVSYRVLVISCFTLIIINALLVYFSFILRRRTERKTAGLLKKPGKRLLVVGNNRDSMDILESAADSGFLGFLSDDFTSEEAKGLFLANLPYVSLSRPAGDGFIFASLFKGFIDTIYSKRTTPYLELLRTAIDEVEAGAYSQTEVPKLKYCIVINTQSDERNMRICRELSRDIRSYCMGREENHAEIADLFSLIQIYVYGDPKLESLYSEIVEESFGVVRFENKYRQIAYDFVERYPLTHFMTETQIDTENFLLRRDVDVNVLLFGFGKTNREIFMTSVASSQFIVRSLEKENREGLVLHPVKYHVFDRYAAENNRKLNHDYYRYRNEFLSSEPSLTKKREDYLPLPMLPAEEHYHHMDIYDTGFYNMIHGILSRSDWDVNYVVIAFGTDLENIDFAKKILEKRKEWGLDNTHIFVKVRSCDITSNIFREDEKCHVIGSEKKIVYNLKSILQSSTLQMALSKSLSVCDSCQARKEKLFHFFTSGTHDTIKATQVVRDSNLYAMLALRSKLHMMGLDCTDATGNGEPLTEAQYLSVYLKRAVSESEVSEVHADLESGKTLEYYRKCMDSRCTMALQEHYRWNSYMIMEGFVPASKELIENEVMDGRRTYGRNYGLRRHGNLTTYEGLLTFQAMTDIDVIRYDYDLMDKLFRYLPPSMKIIRRLTSEL